MTKRRTVIYPAFRDYHNDCLFDIHAGQWPEQPLFYLPLFSTTRYDEVHSVTVRYPDGRVLTHLNLDRYRNGIQKHALETCLHAARGHPVRRDEWVYAAVIALNSGETAKARDYVEIIKMPQPVDSLEPAMMAVRPGRRLAREPALRILPAC